MVGADRLQETPYIRAKLEQEKLIKESGIPYSIVHATQFFEFWQGIADGATDGNKVRVPPVFIQPIAADDVAASVAKVAIGKQLNGMVEVTGPQRFHFNEFIRKGLLAGNDPREVVADPNARYFGAKLGELTLVASGDARIGQVRFEEWLSPAMSHRQPGRAAGAVLSS